MKKATLLFFLFQVLFLIQGSAQADNPDFFRSIGKIYVVVAVVLAVFIGIIIFLVYLDRKVTKLENQIKDNE